MGVRDGLGVPLRAGLSVPIFLPDCAQRLTLRKKDIHCNPSRGCIGLGKTAYCRAIPLRVKRGLEGVAGSAIR
jgi:hypothetical protein